MCAPQFGPLRDVHGPRRNKKKSQYIMNNAINEIKNTLEATNSRIMEAKIGLVKQKIEW